MLTRLKPGGGSAGADGAASFPPDDAPPTFASLDRPHAQEPLSLRRNSSWMLVGNVVYATCQWAMLSVLAKLGTPATVGQFVLALAVTAPVMAFFMLQLRTVQATDARGEYPFGDYLALRLLTTVLALATIGGIGLLVGYRRETALVIIAAAASAAIDSLSDVGYGLLQQRERMDRIAQSMIVKGVTSLAALTVAILATGQLFYGILAIAAARIVVVVAWDLPNAARVLRRGSPGTRTTGTKYGGLVPRWNARRLFALARLSLPLGIVTMLIALSGNTPRYFVEHCWGEHSLGIFGALAYLTLVGTTVVRAFGQSATPRLAHYYASGQSASFGILILKLGVIAAMVGVAGVIVAFLAGPQILTVIYGPEYAEYNHILVWTMVAGAIGYVASIGSSGISAARYFRVQIPLFALAVGAAAGTCAWLVPRTGLLGAALALSAAALTQLLGGGLVILYALWAQATVRPESMAAYTSTHDPA